MPYKCPNFNGVPHLKTCFKLSNNINIVKLQCNVKKQPAFSAQCSSPAPTNTCLIVWVNFLAQAKPQWKHYHDGPSSISWRYARRCLKSVSLLLSPTKSKKTLHVTVCIRDADKFRLICNTTDYCIGSPLQPWQLSDAERFAGLDAFGFMSN